ESVSLYKVIDGLNAGEKVVTNGVFSVDAAAQLNNQRSMMNRLVGEQETAEETIEQEDPESVTAGGRQDLSAALEAYIALKDDLIEGKPEEIRSSLAHLQSVAGDLGEREDLSSFSSDWNSHVKNFKSHLGLLLKEKDVEGWRTAFSPFSQVMIHWVLEFGNPGKSEIFVQHCPMANDDEGGDWLSYDSNIRNPYYGEAMMACGVTTEALPYS